MLKNTTTLGKRRGKIGGGGQREGQWRFSSGTLSTEVIGKVWRVGPVSGRGSSGFKFLMFACIVLIIICRYIFFLKIIDAHE